LSPCCRAAPLLLAALALTGCHGHTLRGAYVPNHGEDFDFRAPPCVPAERPAAEAKTVTVRYLGTGGLYLEWRGVGLLTAPFFSNYGLWRAAFGRIGIDRTAVETGLRGVDLGRIAVVLAGHSHYDHVGDLPALLEGLPETAQVLVNRSGHHMLTACPGAAGRLRNLEDLAPGWVHPNDADGEALPVRILPVVSGHAPQLKHYRYARGEVDGPWDSCLDGRRVKALREGRTFAFVVDLLDEHGATVFRMFYQDAAAAAPLGFPPLEPTGDTRPYDLVVLCLASSWLADDYPAALLAHTGARHALVTHYEDFFRPAQRPTRFVASLTNRRANRFMEQVRSELWGGDHDIRGPTSDPCGPSGDGWTVPLPGEWMSFASRR
jgi:hypothetical protein